MMVLIFSSGLLLAQNDRVSLNVSSDENSTESKAFSFGDVEFTGAITNITQRAARARRGYVSGGSLSQNSWSVDLELNSQLGKDVRFHSLHEAGTGAGLDDILPSFSGFNFDANDDGRLATTEAWCEYQKGVMGLRFRLGKIYFPGEFDSSSFADCEVTQFISPGFVNGLTLEFPEEYDFGAMLWYPFADYWEAGIGVVEKFSIFELAFRHERNGRKGNYRVYRWFNKFDHQHLVNPADNAAENDGYGLSFDQEISDRIGLFARYGRQRDEVAEMDNAWSVGVQHLSPFKCRPEDVIGVAYGQANWGNAGRNNARLAGIDTSAEHHLELYYSLYADDNFVITPSAQWIKNAAGDGANGSAWIFGLRSYISF
jgi:hypothetical protein